MNAAAVTWKLLRVARWALWIAFLGYCFYVHAYHEALVNQFVFSSLPPAAPMTRARKLRHPTHDAPD